MNYYTPYFNMYPNAAMPMTTTTSRGLFSRLFGRFNLGTILTNTQKTLNIVNQAIPVIKQASPVIRNAKTMFKVMNEFKKVDNPRNEQNINENISLNTNSENNNINNSVSHNSDGGPTFFIN